MSLDYRPFERVRDDWSKHLRMMVANASEEQVAAFVVTTNELMDALINRAVVATVQASGIVESEERHKRIEAALRQLQQAVNTITAAMLRQSGKHDE